MAVRMGDFFSGKAVVVTGADGFIGSHLVERLVESGAEVRAFVFYNSWNSIGWLAEAPGAVRDAIEIVTGYVRAAHSVARCQQRSASLLCAHIMSTEPIPFDSAQDRAVQNDNIVEGR